MKVYVPGFHLGGAGGGAFAPPCWMFAPPPLEILLYIYCIVQHVALAPPWYAKTAILPPLSKILNAALTVAATSNNLIIGRAKRASHWGVQSRFRVIYIYVYTLSVCRSMSVVCQINCVGGITWPTRILKVFFFGG